jgi:hypothetical protein
LKQRVGEREKWREQIEQSKRMRQWVLDAEHILDGSWAAVQELGGTGEQDMRNAGLTNKDVGLRVESWRLELTQKLTAGVLNQTERECLEQLLQVLDNLRPHLIQCDDLSSFPRTNKETEGSIRRTKARYRRISGRKNWNNYLLRFGRSLAFYEWWEADPPRWQPFEKMAQQVSPDLWRQMRKETTSAQSEQLKRFRFRHKRATYLAALEDRWAAAAQSSLLP